MPWSGNGVKLGEDEKARRLIDKSCNMEEVKGHEKGLNFSWLYKNTEQDSDKISQ